MTNPIDGLRDGTLLPCPFCGSAAERDGGFGGYVKCANVTDGKGGCHMALDWVGEAQWNTRSPDLLRALRDAERYGFLRDVGPPDSSGYPTILQWELVTQSRYSGNLLFGPDLDAAIDAAMQRGGDE